MTAFTLHPQLAHDCTTVGDLPLSRLLLLNDSRYPWLVLVPRRAAVTELFDLEPGDRALLLEETCLVGEQLMRLCGGDKLNVGALGNLVAQLHVHVVSRAVGDPAWPGPVWGHSAALPYAEPALVERLDLLRGVLVGEGLTLP
jgi:diadenosine tetraphosphate (Ap4A) HIT family hydrolase